ncbi:MAG TPA: WavE lipopolysaccharide synthesis family protein [Verrucomicrobiae bacterium]
MPLPSKISLVFQGPVFTPEKNPKLGHLTRDCIEATRQLFPEAEIILSTWEGSLVEGIPCDRVVLNKDPGSWLRDDGGRSNVNRQIVSTRNGLAQASRPFAAKIRTDTVITGTGFLNFARSSSDRLAKWAIFSERILILERYTRNPALLPLLHHPSDIFQFGRTDDLIYLWDIPLSTPDINQAWHKHHPKPLLTPFPHRTIYSKCCEEQYVWLQCLRRQHPEVDLDYLWQARLGQIFISESLLTANFIIAAAEDAGVRLPDRFVGDVHGWPETCYRSEEWVWLTTLYQSDKHPICRRLRILRVWLGVWWKSIWTTAKWPCEKASGWFRFHVLSRLLRKP